MSEAHHPEKGAFLRDLAENERFIGYYILSRKQLEPFRDPTRGHYLSLMLSDRSGQVGARVWEGAEEVSEDVLEGDVVKIDGEVESYNKRLQVRINRIRTAQPDEYDLRDLLKASARDVDEMRVTLAIAIDSLVEPQLKSLIDLFFGDAEFIAQFSQAPAARRLHHATLHGLLEHCIETLALAETVCALYPDINRDLLITGVVLHDIGKLREYRWELDIETTDEGQLIGHIAITDHMLNEALSQLADFPEGLALQLRHMLLAHHGRYEWGSPRRPKTMEAIALHHVENLSAQLNRFHTLIEARALGEEWTEYDRLLRRQLYGGKSDDLNIEESSLRD
jgi:3'-5' exoribonuclease